MTNLIDLEKTDEFIIQSIKKLNPDFDVSASDPFYDLFIRFFRDTDLPEILRLYQEIIDSRSLLNTDVSEELYNRLLANLKFPRKGAQYHSVKMQLVLNSPETVQIRTVDDYVIADKIYHPKFNTTIQATDFIVEQNSVYTIEFELVAENKGVEDAVGINTTVVTPFDELDSFTRAYTTNVVQIGQDAESNLEVLARLQKEFGLENLINKRGINFILSKYFSESVTSTYVAGYSEPEQKRDTIRAEIPKRVARLFFENKVDLVIPNTSRFFYGFSRDSKYILRENITVSIPEDSTLWKQHPTNNKFYIDIEIELEDLYSLQDFREDIRMENDYLSLAYPDDFLNCISRTTLLEEADLRYGGHTDVYLKTTTNRIKIPLFVPLNSNGILDIPKTYQPLLKIHGIQEILTDNTVSDVLVYDILVKDPKLRFSSRDEIQLFVQPSKVGTTILIDATVATKINEIQEFFDSPIRKVIASDVLVRYYNPCFIAIIGIISGSPTLDPQIKTACSDYINSLTTGTWKMADFVTTISNQVPAFRTIFLDSINIIIQQIFPDGTAIMLEGEEIITPIEDENLGVTTRNTTYLLEAVEMKYL